MGISVSPTFTATTGRRKPLVTYGKVSRAPASPAGDEHSASAKQEAASARRAMRYTSSKDTANGIGSSTRAGRRRSPHDASEDGGRPSAGKRKKPPPRDEFDVPSTDEEPATPPRRVSKARPLRKPEADQRKRSVSRQPNAVAKVPSKPASRAPTPAPVAPAHRRNKSAPALAVEKVGSKKRDKESDVFDLPSSDQDEPPAQPRRPALPARKHKAKAPTPSPILAPSPQPNAESDDSATWKKRKRLDAKPTPSVNGLRRRNQGNAQKAEDAVPQRSSKDKARHAASEDAEPPAKKQQREVQRTLADVGSNKPKRPRTGHTPVPGLPKSGSSPAKLHGMLALRGPRPTQTTVDHTKMPAAPMRDQIMEDNPSTPPRKRQASAVPESGSVTPRQKQIWSSLLGGPPEAVTPTALSMAKLQLSERRTVRTRASLFKSVSDVSTASPRKPSLIANLMQAGVALKHGELSENEATVDSADTTPTVGTRLEAGNSREWSTEPSSSQPLQAPVLLNGGSKVTYAKERSYLEEVNMEDELMYSLPMETDSPVDVRGGCGLSLPVSEEEDAANKVRGIHELRKKGQHDRFVFDTQALLDDAAVRAKSERSRRRSAMLELATKMMDPEFMKQFVNAALEQHLLKNLASDGDVIFDFAAAVAACLLVNAGASFNVLDQVYRSDALATLSSLLALDSDVRRIARERGANLSKVAQSDAMEFRTRVLESSIWAGDAPEKVTPQLVAMRAMERLVVRLRQAGSTDGLLDDKTVAKLLDIASGPCSRLADGASAMDVQTVHVVFSIVESASYVKREAPWSNKTLRRLAELTPALFNAQGTTVVKLGVKLCMNLTNNRPKACDVFGSPGFVRPLVRSIHDRFALLAGSSLDETQRQDELDSLILSLGAMINLAEYSAAARASVLGDDTALLDGLVQSFVGGHERAAHAASVAESQSSVATGYLAVLLGNLCEDDAVRRAARARLPGGRLDVLVQAVDEFIRYNEKVDRDTRAQFDGAEGLETWVTFTRRLQAVVDRLRRADA